MENDIQYVKFFTIDDLPVLPDDIANFKKVLIDLGFTDMNIKSKGIEMIKYNMKFYVINFTKKCFIGSGTDYGHSSISVEEFLHIHRGKINCQSFNI